MTDLTNVPVRNINDLELAENIPLDASVLDAVKIPVGGLTQFTQGEALSLKQLREVLVAAMPGWVPSTIDDLIARSDAEVQKMLEKYLNAIKDVSVVLDAIQGQINESHLALDLNKKIDLGTLANGAAIRAQESANAAYAAAGAAADAARAEGQAAVEHANQRVEEAKQLIEQAKDSAQEAKDAAQNALTYAEAEVLKAKNLAQQAVDQANGVLTVTQEGINEAKNLAQQAVKQANDVLDVTIEEINAAKQEAQQLTEQARQAAQALVTALDEKFTALNGNINTEISNLNAGLTQETTARQEGLAQITTTLNAYKEVVNDNLAVLFSKNETIVSDAVALATQVNALKSQVALVEGKLPLKLDASVIQNYYTKAQSEANATTIAAGEITKYDSQLVIGGVNQLLNSEAERTASPREYMMYENSAHIKDFYNNNLGKDVTVSFDLKVPVAGPVQVYCSNGTHHGFSTSVSVAASDVNKWVRYAVTVKPLKKVGTEAITRSGLEFYVTYDTGRFPSVRKVQLEAGNKATDWSPSPRDTQASLDANATAIQNTDTEVSRINGAVVSQGQSLTTLQNNLNITNSEVAKKANASVVDGVTSRVAATESGLTSVGNRTTALENSVNHATTGLATKASTSALSTTNSNVSAIDGTVKGHTNQLTQLSSDIVTLNNGLATKLDSSVISNYYTKAQTDAKAESIAAGKVEEFNANLIIGGTNLVTKSYKNFRVGTAAAPALDREILADGSLKLTSNNLTGNSYLAYWVGASSSMQAMFDELVVDNPFTVTLWFKAVDPQNLPTSEPTLYFGSSLNYLSLNADLTQLASGKEVAYTYTRNWSGLTSSIPHLSFSAAALGGGLILTKWKVEKGSKSTDWTESPQDTQNSINANSTAIQNTNAEVTRVDGRITATNSTQSLLEGRVSTVEGEITKKADATALSSLATRVGTEEGKSLSQGNAITALQNTINHATTGLATKASTAALTSTNSEVSRVDGVVKGHTNQLTQLSSDIVTLNNGLATKLDSSVISNYYTKAQTDTKAESIAAGKVEEFNASLKSGGDNVLKSSNEPIVKEAGAAKYFLGRYFAGFSNADMVGKRFTLTACITVKNIVGTQYLCAYQSGTSPILFKETALTKNADKAIVHAVFDWTVSTNQLSFYLFPNRAADSTNAEVIIHWAVMVEGDSIKAASWYPAASDTQAALDANSTAIQNTNAEVTRVDGVATTANNATTALAGRVSTVEGAVATKAEAAALTSLTTRVSNAEGVNTSQGSAITALENSVNHASTGLASKASSSALTAVDNKVTAANGRIDTTNSNVTTLTGRVSTVEGAVSTKAEAAALTALTTRVGNAEGVNTSQGSAITTLQNTVNHSTTGLATKASTAALTATNSEVTRINGVVAGHTNQLTQLTSDITAINGTLATKANASALNDIYTKTQTDAKATEIAAGEVSKYDASLVIGGVNLIPNSFDIPQYSNDGSRYPIESVVVSGVRRFRRTGVSSNTLSNYTGVFVDLPVGTEYTISVKVKPIGSDYSLGFYGVGASTQLCKADQWTTLQATIKVVAQPERVRALVSSAAQMGVWVEVKEWQAEIGNKATAWSPAPEDTQNSINANATAINNTNTEIVRVEGKTTVNANNISGLTSRMGTVEGKVSTKAEASALQNYYTKTEAEANATTVAAGEVAKYDASLIIGGTNLLSESNKFLVGGGGSGITKEVLSDGSLKLTGAGGAYHSFTPAKTQNSDMSMLKVGDKFTVTLWVKPVDVNNLPTQMPHLYLETDMNYRNNFTVIGDLSKGGLVRYVQTRTCITSRTKLGNTHMHWYAGALGGGLIIEKWQIEVGTKSSDWSPGISDTQNQIDANATAIVNTNTEVSRVEGKTTVNANNISGLTSRMGTVEGKVSTKAEASALQNYYTKTEAAANATTVAAGEVAKYDASLVIGGTNLLTDSNFAKAASSSGWASNGGGYTKVTDPVHGSVVQTNLPNGLTHAWVKLENAVEYTYSALVKPSINLTMSTSNPLHYHAGVGNVHQSKIQVLSASHTTIEAGKWTRISIVFKLTGDADSFKPFIYGLSGVLQLAWTKLERGNKATDWTPSVGDVQSNLDANATAITNTNTEVTRVDGRVTTESNRITTLTGRVTVVEGAVATKADVSAVNALTTRVGNVEGGLVTQANNTTALKAAMEVVGTAAPTSSEELDLTSLDPNTYYPVLFALSGNTRTRIQVSAPLNASQNGKPVWSTHSGGFSCMYDWETNASGWGANLVTRTILTADNLYSTQPPAIDIDQLRNSSREYIFLRGGAKYTARYSNAVSSTQIVTASTTLQTQVIAPKSYDASKVIGTSLNEKATAEALTSTNSEVSRVNGVVVSQGGQLTQLSSSIQTINGTLNTKLDSSVISNYYTKAQSDTAAGTIATGKIDVFKSSLSASAMDNLVNGGNEAKTKTGGYLVVQYQLSKPVVVGKTYTIRAKVSFSNGGNAAANLRFYLGGQTAFHPSGGITAAVEDIIEVSAVVTTGTAQQVSFYCFPNSTANANAVTTIHWVEVFEGSNLTLNEKATAAALSTTNSEVSRINGEVVGQASQLTTIQASVGDVLDTINIKDTRSTNQPPTWYRANYARRRVSEFKTQTVIGVGGFFPGTYCNLETLVHYGDASGGPILQTATATNDPTLYVQRYSTGSGTSEVWGAWTQPIKDLRDGISGKADASVVNAISVKVDGMSSHASQLTTLTSELNKAKNQLAIEAQVINGIQANYMVKMETNGVLAGFGLIQESGAMGAVTSSFGVNANNFFIGAPSSNKKPFVVTTSATAINGVTYPAGTWIDTAMIANATIGGAKIVAASIDTAQITDGAITNAKIENLAVTGAKIANATIGTAQIANLAVTAAKIANATITAAEIANATITGAKIAGATIGSAQIADAAITTAKIGDLQVDTLKIKDNAVTVPSYLTDYTALSSNYMANGASVEMGKIQLTGISAGQAVIVFVQAVPVEDTYNINISAECPNRNGAIEAAIYQGTTKVRSLGRSVGGRRYEMVWQENEGGGGGWINTLVDAPAKLGIGPQAIPVMIVAASNNPTISVKISVSGNSASVTKTGGISFIALGIKK